MKKTTKCPLCGGELFLSEWTTEVQAHNMRVVEKKQCYKYVCKKCSCRVEVSK